MTTTVQLEVVSPGAYASVQDVGRRGYRKVGVPWAGALDRRLMRIANALVGNPEGTPIIECFDGGQQFAARHGAVRLAVAGDAVLELISNGERRVLMSWCSMTLAEGEVLRLRHLEHSRIAVVAVEGLTLPPVLGSASTYARAALGGVDGRALTTGALLPTSAACEGKEKMLSALPSVDSDAVRVVAGPQSDHFSPESLASLVNTAFRVTSEADRMGVRLEGPPLQHAGAPEIISDGTVPGSIQVPGNGQPIVLLADAQTAGGYPKIATVISADLARVAAARPGQTLRFQWVDAQAGEQLARDAEIETRRLLASVRPLMAGGIDEEALYAGSLVTGFIDALSPEYRLVPEHT